MQGRSETGADARFVRFILQAVLVGIRVPRLLVVVFLGGRREHATILVAQPGR